MGPEPSIPQPLQPRPGSRRCRFLKKAQFLRPRVYVAGPISLGDARENCLQAIQMGFVLMDRGYAPYVPHYSWFVDVDSTRGKGRYEQWISVDLAWISVSQALLRLPGPSPGADREVAWARHLGIPVFFTLEELMKGVPAGRPVKQAPPAQDSS